MSNKTNAKDKAERRRRKVIAMFSDATNAPTVQDAARILGVSAKTVERDLKAVRADMKEAESKLEEYQRRLKKRLPLEKRVELLAEIAEQEKKLFGRFKAVQRVDALDGIITDGERLKIEREREQTTNQPLFVFNGGMQISFGPTTTSGNEASLHNIPSAKPDVRNITPLSDSESTD